jgi:hypothetical protein
MLKNTWWRKSETGWLKSWHLEVHLDRQFQALSTPWHDCCPFFSQQEEIELNVWVV